MGTPYLYGGDGKHRWMQIAAVSPQAKDRLFKSVRRYLTDFGAAECRRDIELCFVTEGSTCADIWVGGSVKSCNFAPQVQN